MINNMIDANHEIEVELNLAVSEFLTHCSNDVCKPIIQPKEGTFDKQSLSHFKDNIIVKIPNLYNDIQTIINDPIVTQFLMNSLSDLILVAYEEFLKSVDVEASLIGDDETLDLMEIDALSGFIGDTINQLYEDERQDMPRFNEEILENLAIEDADADPLAQRQVTTTLSNFDPTEQLLQEQHLPIDKSPSPTSAI